MKRVRIELERPGIEHTLVLYVDDLDAGGLQVARSVLKKGARIKQAVFQTYTMSKEERML